MSKRGEFFYSLRRSKDHPSSLATAQITAFGEQVVENALLRCGGAVLGDFEFHRDIRQLLGGFVATRSGSCPEILRAVCNKGELELLSSADGLRFSPPLLVVVEVAVSVLLHAVNAAQSVVRVSQ
jgi:acetylornithine/succinyldiaminopimelate/putrescine aminotransferase